MGDVPQEGAAAVPAAPPAPDVQLPAETLHQGAAETFADDAAADWDGFVGTP